MDVLDQAVSHGCATVALLHKLPDVEGACVILDAAPTLVLSEVGSGCHDTAFPGVNLEQLIAEQQGLG